MNHGYQSPAKSIHKGSYLTDRPSPDTKGIFSQSSSRSNTVFKRPFVSDNKYLGRIGKNTLMTSSRDFNT